MPATVRRARQEEIPTVVAVLETAAGRHPAPEPAADDSYDADRTLLAVDGDVIVGATSSESIEVTVPGPRVLTAAKISLTGLLPTHRNQGLATALMREQLADLRLRGEPLAVLMTAQAGVPAVNGFSPATDAMSVRFRPRTSGSASGATTSVRLRVVTGDEASETLPAVYDRHRRTMPGQVSRSARFWSEWFEDRPLVRIGSSERFFVLAETAEGCVGYLSYRLDYGALREQPVPVIHIEDLVAHGDARRALWRFCLEFTQAAEGRAWNVPVDDSVRWLPDVLRDIEVTALRHFLHLRLVDVPTALAARSYTNAGSVVLDLTDPVLPSNAGRFALQADSANTSCLPTDLPADVRLSVSDLAAVYLGAVSFRTLIAAGRVTCTSDMAPYKLDEMFQVDSAPWTVTDW